MIDKNKVDVRLFNRQRSPKRGGNSDIDAAPYLNELDIELIDNPQPIKFFDNRSELVHRWAPYVQGFSASFVQSQFNRYRKEYHNPIILDPFAGCGTVLVQSKLNGFTSFGTELNPLLQFVANRKLKSWDINPNHLWDVYINLTKGKRSNAPKFLKNEKHFNPKVLENLEMIKGGIDSISEDDMESVKIKDLLLVAFSSILIESSNLVRSPCLGYSKKKKVADNTPYKLMEQKVQTMVKDIHYIQNYFQRFIDVESCVYLANAKEFNHENKFNLVITSPPYMNGLDYVINYKIEMGWLDFADNHINLKQVKDEMVVCDNVSKGLIKKFALKDDVYTNEWIEPITNNIRENIKKRGNYRRMDMPFIVHKYFDDMYQVMKKVVCSMSKNGRFILVVGDSLIADVYLPTDLLIARIGKELGLQIEKIEKARERRSGQIRSYKLRETIITLHKE